MPLCPQYPHFLSHPQGASEGQFSVVSCFKSANRDRTIMHFWSSSSASEKTPITNRKPKNKLQALAPLHKRTHHICRCHHRSYINDIANANQKYHRHRASPHHGRDASAKPFCPFTAFTTTAWNMNLNFDHWYDRSATASLLLPSALPLSTEYRANKHTSTRLGPSQHTHAHTLRLIRTHRTVWSRRNFL